MGLVKRHTENGNQTRLLERLKMKRFVLPIILPLFALFFLQACQNNVNEQAATNFVQTADGAHASIGIEGMFCEQGCARFIEESLTDLEGVKQVQVYFNQKRAEVVFDESALDGKDLVNHIEDLQDGLYDVTTIDLEESEKVENDQSAAEALENKAAAKAASGAVKIKPGSEQRNFMIRLPNIVDIFSKLFRYH